MKVTDYSFLSIDYKITKEFDGYMISIYFPSRTLITVEPSKWKAKKRAKELISNYFDNDPESLRSK